MIHAFSVGKPPHDMKSWQGKVRHATDLVYAMTRHVDSKDPVTIRTNVIKVAREALGPAESRKFHRRHQEEDVVSSAGLYRLIIDDAKIDRMNPFSAESLMDVVQKRIQEIEQDPDELRRMCGGD